MKLLEFSAILCASLGVPYLFLALLGPPPTDLVPLSVLACLLGFIVPPGRSLAWGASVVAAALVSLYVWLDDTVQLEQETIGAVISAGVLWLLALLTAGCFGLVLFLRMAIDAARRFFGRHESSIGQRQLWE